MSIKILTKNSIDNTNIDGARANHFSAGMRSGVVKGAFNEGRFFASASNIIALDTCELRISGHQVIIDSLEAITLNDRPSIPTKYSMIAEIQVSDSSVPSFRLFIQPANVSLKKDNLFKTNNGSGTYQLRIGNFTLGTNGLISDVFRTVDIITGGGYDGVADIKFNATATKLSSDSEPDVNVDYNEETGEYDMHLGIPVGGGGGTSITVDSELSTTSTNPVQNKVITEALNNINNNGADLTNYYTKDETYSKTEVDRLVSEIEPDVDLSDYYTKSEVDDKIAGAGGGSGGGTNVIIDGKVQSTYDATFLEALRGERKFQQVEYVESTGTQYINTGIKLNNNTRVVIDFAISSSSTEDGALFGARSGGGSTDTYIIWANNNQGSANVSFVFGGSTNQQSLSTDTRYSVDVSANGMLIDGVMIGNAPTQATFSGSYTAILFGMSSGGAFDSRGFKGKVYSAKIYQKGELMRDYVPCYRKSDNIIGLFDKVTGVFYTNAGTGTFVKGGDVETTDIPEAIGGDLVVESYISSDGNTWYRKYASGWKECGGKVKTNIQMNASSAYDMLVSLPIEFSNANYCVYLSNQWNGTQGGHVFWYTGINKNTTTQLGISAFNFMSDNAVPAGNASCVWLCMGY